MKKLLFLLLWSIGLAAQEPNTIYLLVRGDDIGSSHAANVGCIEAYQKGIMRSVELMVPCPWFPQAIEMLKQNPGLDVGIHLVLTSEWENMKWRPLTCAPELTDSNGFFYPMVWQREDFAPKTSLQYSGWTEAAIEKEMKAQIEMALKHLPNISHMGCHMGCAGLDPKIRAVESKLEKQYGLDIDMQKYNIKHFAGWDNKSDYNIPSAQLSQTEKIDIFCKNLEKLSAGVYLFIEHPAKNFPEMTAIGHQGYYSVATDRDDVTAVFTSEKVKQMIAKKKIKLISYADLKRGL